MCSTLSGLAVMTTPGRPGALKVVACDDQAERHGRTLDMQHVFECFTFDNICHVAFGEDPGCGVRARLRLRADRHRGPVQSAGTLSVASQEGAQHGAREADP